MGVKASSRSTAIRGHKFPERNEKLPKLKFGHMCCEFYSMSELSGFVYNKSHVTLLVKSKAQKVNCKTRCCISWCALSLTKPTNCLLKVVITLRPTKSTNLAYVIHLYTLPTYLPNLQNSLTYLTYLPTLLD